LRRRVWVSRTRATTQKLLEDVKARKIDVVVVYKVDRLMRPLTMWPSSVFT
jgi:DNA invertase Pin-like site-specific DNA recombinase